MEPKARLGVSGARRRTRSLLKYMQNSLRGNSLFIDFDSTFVKVETIDEIAKLTLDGDPNKQDKIKRISAVTSQAMCGEIDFPTALNLRLQTLNIDRDAINQVTESIGSLVSDSFNKNKNIIKENAADIWIISGGFTQVIAPIVREFGITRDHILANDFIFSGDQVSGCDKENFLFQDKGKIKAINSVDTPNSRVMIGDGYTDLEVYLEGAANQFICYTENISRDKVLEKSRYSAGSFSEILDILHQI